MLRRLARAWRPPSRTARRISEPRWATEGAVSEELSEQVLVLGRRVDATEARLAALEAQARATVAVVERLGGVVERSGILLLELQGEYRRSQRAMDLKLDAIHSSQKETLTAIRAMVEPTKVSP